MDARTKTLLACGFVPEPAYPLVKHDARGEEYGHYRAGACSRDGRSIAVCKFDGNGIFRWRAEFDDMVSFSHWAEDHT